MAKLKRRERRAPRTPNGFVHAPCPSVFPDSADAMEIGFSAWKQNE